MIRVAEHVARTHTGRQRASNEDFHLELAPVFAVADGMGGAQAGEVASQLAIAHFAANRGPEDGASDAQWLVTAAHDANAEIHALAEADTRRAGMGTTLIAAYVGATDVFLAHVGDSRAYRWRGGELERLTEDHSLVEELLRQGRLTEEEAEEHPQRSIITRALGPEPEVEVDSLRVDAAAGDVYLLCSDGLTSMVGEPPIADILRARADDLAATADALIDAALAAGGRDNITVVLFRLEDVEEAGAPDATEERAKGPRPSAVPPRELDPPTERHLAVPAPAAGARVRRVPRPAARATRRPGERRPARRRWRRRLQIAGVIVALIAILATAGILAAQSVYFIGTNTDGEVTIYNGLPYTLAGGVRLYTQFFVSGVTVAELSPLERKRLFTDDLRSLDGATKLVSQLELGKIAGQ